MTRSTRDAAYTDRQRSLEGAWWKRLLDVQRPYRWHVRRLRLGFVLDVGCGLGRNLIHLEGKALRLKDGLAELLHPRQVERLKAIHLKPPARRSVCVRSRACECLGFPVAVLFIGNCPKE